MGIRRRVKKDKVYSDDKTKAMIDKSNTGILHQYSFLCGWVGAG
jgi:hypothetical protein